MNEPLLGRAKDDRIVAAPAVRIAVLQLAFGHEIAARFQQGDDGGIGLEDGLAFVLGQPFDEAAVVIERRVRLDAVFLADVRNLRRRGREPYARCPSPAPA